MCKGFKGRKKDFKDKIMEYEVKDKNICLKGIKCLNIGLCCDCGQAFRWRKEENGVIHGVVKGKAVDIKETKEEIIFYNTDEESFKHLWLPYFDLERDYESIVGTFDDESLKKALREFYGIRILKQDEWEALCSFIISQNNNIPRIKGIIERLCENFGEKINDKDFSFPSYEKIARLKEEDLAPLRAGFRNRYILDAARKIQSGEISLEKIKALPIEQAREELMKIKGVGKKVAECTLLYGFGRIEAFPIDVWVKRILEELYPNGLPKCFKGAEGIAQQYLFHWRRNSKEFENE